MNNYFIAGQATFAMNYFAFLPALSNQGTDPDYYDKVGFFSNPPGPYGQQFASLGGQGTSINSYISDERKQASFEFIKWFASDAVQQKWAELGGYTCNKKALDLRCLPEGHALQHVLRRDDGLRQGLLQHPRVRLAAAARPDRAQQLTSSTARARPRKRSTRSLPSTRRS